MSTCMDRLSQIITLAKSRKVTDYKVCYYLYHDDLIFFFFFLYNVKFNLFCYFLLFKESH